MTALKSQIRLYTIIAVFFFSLFFLRKNSESFLVEKQESSTALNESNTVLDQLRGKVSGETMTVIITIANYAHLQMTLNWVEMMKIQGHEQEFFIFCLDRKIYNELQSRHLPAALIPQSWLPQSLVTKQAECGIHSEGTWGSAHYNSVTHFKASILLQILLQGYNVIFSDVDVA
jgi:hypothetical protein